MIDGSLKIDFMDEKVVHEVKKSNRMEKAHIGQVLYYLYSLRQKGVDIRKGVINYPKQREITKVELTPEREREIAEAIIKIKKIKALENPPNVLNARICKKCSYEDFCYA